MSIEITLVVLLAAALNAGWNALIKVSGDRVAILQAKGKVPPSLDKLCTEIMRFAALN